MNIFKTFETFLKEPLSILKDNFIQIVSIQTGNIFENKPSVDVSLTKNKAQITVVNNEKLYNLLSLVQMRSQKKEAEKEKVKG
ncbi:MAG: hypothetical protein E7Z92_00845 [Cyanobacteria bacterium SIG31]|nr:hypothetical protein [Cyanobacteria bacterium SIG31]